MTYENELSHDQALIIGSNLKIVLERLLGSGVVDMQADGAGLYLSVNGIPNSSIHLIRDRRSVRSSRTQDHEPDVLVYSVLDDIDCREYSAIRLVNVFKWILNRILNRWVDQNIAVGTIDFSQKESEDALDQ